MLLELSECLVKNKQLHKLTISNLRNLVYRKVFEALKTRSTFYEVIKNV